MLQSINESSQYWWGTLVVTGYWTVSSAAKLDCPLLPRTNEYRPYTQYWPEDPNVLGDVRKRLGSPRYVKNGWDHVNNAWSAGMYYRKIQEIRLSPSRAIEFADAEVPVGYDRVDYFFNSGKGSIAWRKKNHNATPNLSFYDGHVNSMPWTTITDIGNIMLYRKP
jgi:prepilin-type processing-associated H-X9-DG protein